MYESILKFADMPSHAVVNIENVTKNPDKAKEFLDNQINKIAKSGTQPHNYAMIPTDKLVIIGKNFAQFRSGSYEGDLFMRQYSRKLMIDNNNNQSVPTGALYFNSNNGLWTSFTPLLLNSSENSYYNKTEGYAKIDTRKDKVRSITMLAKEGTIEVSLKDNTQIYAIEGTNLQTLIEMNNSKFWNDLAQKHELHMRMGKPGYGNKPVITAWYNAVDPVSETKFYMGTRKRVDELNATFAQPIPIAVLDREFASEDVTKQVENKETNESNFLFGKRLPLETSHAHKFQIHAHTPSKTNEYLGKILDIAREYSHKSITQN